MGEKKAGSLFLLAKEGQARSGAVRRGQARSGAFSGDRIEGSSGGGSAICAAPQSQLEAEASVGEFDVLTCCGRSAVLHQTRKKVDLSKTLDNHTFMFDGVFDGRGSDNVNVYELAARPLVQAVFNGGRATCFAFGQTGSGKTAAFLIPIIANLPSRYSRKYLVEPEAPPAVRIYFVYSIRGRFRISLADRFIYLGHFSAN